ncbi:hypothetical protein [Prosthecobacter sp.]|uniref:hypothetical protein n=1 Tax=Prosthecobacter sp. TaxID=1965333 RepID=UPI003784AC9B
MGPIGFSGGGWGSSWVGGYGGYSGWGAPGYNVQTNPIGRVKIEGDVNFSGQINEADAAMGNEPKRNPYGLTVGAGEMTKLIMTCQPNAYRQRQVGEPKVRMDFYKLVTGLEIKGVNLGDKKGRFQNFEQETATCGRILVWMDSTRRQLLLDSADPSRRRVEWLWSATVPPERIFVEGVRPTNPGGAFIVTYELDDSNKKGISKWFGEPAVWDRQLITVGQVKVPKPKIDRTPTWTTVSGK